MVASVQIREQIPGLIKVFTDGHVDRPHIVPFVSSSSSSFNNVISTDITIDTSTNLWSRFYLPKNNNLNGNLPLLVYFHGGGFCVGSAAWICYHDFLSKLSTKAGCLIMSVNYRLAPENPLPAAYHDGIKSLMWLKQNCLADNKQLWWSSRCNFSNVFLAGDSAGGNIAYNIIKMLGSDYNNNNDQLKPLTINGVVLIQPFFGGEERTNSEKYLVQSERSALRLETSDTYWRLALPYGSSRDHPWCNPLVAKKGCTSVGINKKMLVCIAEMDILKDRNIEFVNRCSNNNLGKKKVVLVVHKGVGHGFHVLSKSKLSQIRTLDMISQIKLFIN